MKYAFNQTFKNRKICISVMETELPTDHPAWIEVSGGDDPLYHEYKDGKYIKLTEEELKELFSE